MESGQKNRVFHHTTLKPLRPARAISRDKRNARVPHPTYVSRNTKRRHYRPFGRKMLPIRQALRLRYMHVTGWTQHETAGVWGRDMHPQSHSRPSRWYSDRATMRHAYGPSNLLMCMHAWWHQRLPFVETILTPVRYLRDN